MNPLIVKNLICDILIAIKQTRREYLSGFCANHDLQIEVEALRKEINVLEDIKTKGL